MLENLLQDLTLAGRMIRRTPAFVLVAIFCIAIGTGAVTTIFSGMNAVMLRPLPGTTEGDRLVMVERRQADGREGASASYRLYERLRDRTTSLDGLAAWSKVDLAIGINGEGHGVYANIVSANYFSVLGVRPVVGRFFTAAEDRAPGSAPVLVVSHSFWTTRLAADPAAVGRTLTVNGHPYTLIGVAPRGFRGAFTPLKVEAWVPLMMQAELRPGRDLADAPWLWLFGRMKPGMTHDAVRRDLTPLTAEHARTAVEPSAFRVYDHIRVTDLTGLPQDARTAFLGFTGILLGAALLVLLIASVNVGSMLTARGIARQGELAVRAALGASRARLATQLLTEVVVLFLLGGAGGVLFAIAATAALEQISIPGAALTLELSPDLRVLTFALALSLVTGILFGLPPALTSARRDLTTTLHQGSSRSSGRRSRFSRGLIVAQLALSLVLLVAAGLFARALEQGQRVNPGFDPTGVVVAPMNSESWGYTPERGRAFFKALRDRAAALPGVTAVSTTAVIPLSASSMGDVIHVTGGSAQRDERVRVEVATVGADYFTVVRIPLMQGRAITAQDDERSPRVAVVNETLAKRYWPDGSALGRTFEYDSQRVTVVGVARDAKYSLLNETTPAFVYFPIEQQWRPDQTLLVRTSLDPSQAARSIQQAVLAIDSALPRPKITTLQRETSVVLLPQRVAAMVTGALGGVGLLLASVGLYGVIAYAVARRTREIGVRVALGATRRDVVAIVLGEGMRLASGGVVVGLVLAGISTRLIASFLFSVSPVDGMTFAATTATLLAVAFVACYLPARRAAAADPLLSLRAE
ncbi:MAG TPA: ABC transporter permease [Vicinamibacterales bacterium]|nr:ABC transporter permease [Vicinamibacterales bacterium]